MITRKPLRISAVLLLTAVLCFAMCATALADYVQGYFRYTISDGSVIITAYTGDEATVTVPAMIAGYPVSTIASGAFADCPEVTTVYLPETVTVVQGGAFAGQGVVHLSSKPAENSSSAAESPTPAQENSSSSSGAQTSAGSSGSSASAGSGNNQTAAGSQSVTGSQTVVTSGNQNSGFTEVDIEDSAAESNAVKPAEEIRAEPAAENLTDAAETTAAAEAAEKPAMAAVAAPEQQPEMQSPAKAEKRSILPVILGFAVLVVLICIMLIKLCRLKKVKH